MKIHLHTLERSSIHCISQPPPPPQQPSNETATKLLQCTGSKRPPKWFRERKRERERERERENTYESLSCLRFWWVEARRRSFRFVLLLLFSTCCAANIAVVANARRCFCDDREHTSIRHLPPSNRCIVATTGLSVPNSDVAIWLVEPAGTTPTYSCLLRTCSTVSS